MPSSAHFLKKCIRENQICQAKKERKNIKITDRNLQTYKNKKYIINKKIKEERIWNKNLNQDLYH